MTPDLHDVLIGLVGAVIAATSAWTYRVSRNFFNQRKAVQKYPISGTYISSYTDVLNGVSRIVRDEVSIKQNVLQFEGISRNKDSKREFVFSGRIVGGRHLLGTYKGERESDEASGVFYMSLGAIHEGKLDGYWAGYGHEGHTALSGTWDWQKCLKVKVRPCPSTSRGMDAAVSLLNDSLGERYVQRTALEGMCRSTSAIVLTAEDSEGRLAGVAMASVLSVEEVAELNAKLQLNGSRKVLPTGTTVGQLKSVAVAPFARRSGVGLNLLKRRLDFLSDLGCQQVITMSWANPESIDTSLGLLKSEGFEVLTEIPNYWAATVGIDQDFDCAVCGSHCTCTAIFLKRSLYDWVAGDGSTARRSALQSRL